MSWLSKAYKGIDKYLGGILPGGSKLPWANDTFGTGAFERMTSGSGYFADKRARKALGEQYDLVKGRIPEVNKYFDDILKQTEYDSGLQQESLLNDFLNESYSFKRKSDVEQGNTGLVFSGDLVNEQNRQQDFMRDQYGIQQDQLASSLEMEKLGIGKSETDELQSIQDLLYRIKTEQESYV